jgi:Tol biopolymer transport system component
MEYRGTRQVVIRLARPVRDARVFAVTLAMGLVSAAWPAIDSAGTPGSAREERTVLVSRASGPHGANANAQSESPSISADGRFVAFESDATNLGRVPFVGAVYVRDLARNRTVLVSRSTGVAGARRVGQAPSISADGRYVAYAGGVTRELGGIAVRDLVAKTTVLASRASGPAGAPADDGGFFPSISADGRFVAFESGATNLDPDDSDRVSDIFVRDLEAQTTTLVSRASGAEGTKANGVFDQGSFSPSISADGRFVAFESAATNLDLDDTDPGRDVFIRDLEAQTTTRVRRASGGQPERGGFESDHPSISADGRFVAFESFRKLSNPDGPVPADYPKRVVLVRDLRMDTTMLVSRASGRSGAKGDADSVTPSISADGRLVAFASGAGLHPYDYNGGARDIYVRDLKAHTTILASRASGKTGARGNDSSLTSVISADGRFVAFDSYASDLHPDDRGDEINISIFARGIGAPPLPRPPRKFCNGRRATIVVLPGGGELPGGGDVFVYRRGQHVIRGSRAADTIEADNGRYRICGRGGDDEIVSGEQGDRIFGGTGWDYIEGSDGRDYLAGGIGHDGLRGGQHDDVLVGGAGDDVLDAGAGRDRIRGGRGNDFIPTAGVSRDRVDCGPGDDRAIVDRHDDVRGCERLRVRNPRRRP